MRKAIFPGSFDPYTIGHHHIIERALPLFDKIVIAFGVNTSKTPFMPIEERIEDVRCFYANNPKIEVIAYQNLTADMAKEQGADYILRGVRSSHDFEYERNIAEANRHLTGIETIILCADPQHAIISSSLVRELAHFGHDIDKYLLR